MRCRFELNNMSALIGFKFRPRCKQKNGSLATISKVLSGDSNFYPAKFGNFKDEKISDNKTASVSKNLLD